MPEVGTSVIIVGSLGETFKKSIETDMRVMEDPKNTAALLEATSLRNILEQWPVLDEQKVYMLSHAMRISVLRFKSSEAALDKILKEIDPKGINPSASFTMFQEARELCKRRDEIRFQIAELNKLSGGVGKASTLPPNADLIIAKIGGS